jgi:serine/threonine-protein kinase
VENGLTSLSEREERFGEIVFAYLQARDEGHHPNPQEWLERYSEFGSELSAFFDDQEEVDRLGAPLREIVGAGGHPSTEGPGATATENKAALPSAAPRSFGDYEVLEEMARGGMGVLYRARQRSLNRLVALKVIRAGEWASAEEVRRFRNEAETVALLDHPHVVPVYEVAEQAGQLYFSMKLVEGGSLAEHLDRYREDPKAAAGLLARVARTVHYAHQRGILHRDLKPSNILLDREGQPHVNDFGLAKRVESDDSLTQTGAIVGTPQYMAPEQTSGRKGAVTTATDVYGLGAVLYALLTGRPPFQGETVLETLEQVRDRDPQPPSKTNPRMDRELEAVCLKCLNKDAGRRYASAEALAEDLERWLRGEPVVARPAGWAERLGRWMRRHHLAVGAVVCVLLSLTALGVAIGWFAGDRAARRAKAAEIFDEVEQQAITSMQEEKWLEANASAQRAADLLAGVGDDPVRQQGLEQLERDLKMAETLELIRLQQAAETKDEHFDSASADPAYAAAFGHYNLPVLELEPEEAAPRLVASAISKQLLAALVDWHNVHPDSVEKKQLRTLLRLADGNAWRQQVWDALDDQDGAKLARLAQSAEALEQPPSRLVALGNILARFEKPAAVQFLRLAQQHHRDDFWINHQLAYYLYSMQPPQLEEAIGFYRAAVALRPHSPGVHVNLGNALDDKGQHDDAIAEYREAIRLKKDFAMAHYNLGFTQRQGPTRRRYRRIPRGHST